MGRPADRKIPFVGPSTARRPVEKQALEDSATDQLLCRFAAQPLRRSSMISCTGTNRGTNRRVLPLVDGIFDSEGTAFALGADDNHFRWISCAWVLIGTDGATTTTQHRCSLDLNRHIFSTFSPNFPDNTKPSFPFRLALTSILPSTIDPL